MINNLTFTGREEMLTKGMKNIARKSYEYVGAGKIYSASEIENAEKMAQGSLGTVLAGIKYDAPFLQSDTVVPIVKQAQNGSASYAISHGKQITDAKINILA